MKPNNTKENFIKLCKWISQNKRIPNPKKKREIQLWYILNNLRRRKHQEFIDEIIDLYDIRIVFENYHLWRKQNKLHTLCIWIVEHQRKPSKYTKICNNIDIEEIGVAETLNNYSAVWVNDESLVEIVHYYDVEKFISRVNYAQKAEKNVCEVLRYIDKNGTPPYKSTYHYKLFRILNILRYKQDTKYNNEVIKYINNNNLTDIFDTKFQDREQEAFDRITSICKFIKDKKRMPSRTSGGKEKALYNSITKMRTTWKGNKGNGNWYPIYEEVLKKNRLWSKVILSKFICRGNKK